MPFQRPETIQCKVEVKNTNTGAYTDPNGDTTHMKITITDPDGTVVVNNVAMDWDAVGKYHYDYTPLITADIGRYRVRYVATDGAQVTIEDDSFVLEE